ncbi:hypothetical protein [Streptomyces sp. WMMB303]|uniref:hypothetical protein n=1 Tax=Streptomyces sp. WMMB303 TaxID=3034154 RepID=UPI0023EDCA9B|nr:hypothetical protein [Streptomyces sp. WMMB303]MDF4250449.1 hypothetical protein [Streptomyces sp. WMMB303]
MSPELITAALLAAPAAVLGPVCIAGHLITARHDERALAAAVAARPTPGNPGGPGGPGEGEPLPDPADLADLAEVITLHPRRDHAA